MSVKGRLVKTGTKFTNMEKKIVRKWISTISGFEIEGSISETIEKLQKLREEFPESSVYLEYGDDYCNLEIYQDRLETDQEAEDRIEREARYKRQREADQRAQYEKLKAIYGG